MVNKSKGLLDPTDPGFQKTPPKIIDVEQTVEGMTQQFFIGTSSNYPKDFSWKNPFHVFGLIGLIVLVSSVIYGTIDITKTQHKIVYSISNTDSTIEKIHISLDTLSEKLASIDDSLDVVSKEVIKIGSKVTQIISAREFLKSTTTAADKKQ